MSFILFGNILKGWPCPSIVDEVAQPATGVTVPEAGVGHLDSAGAWVLGVSSVNQTPHFFRNGSTDGDAGKPFVASQDYNQVNYGAVQGISFSNPLKIQTARYAVNGDGFLPQKGDQLFADTDGCLKTAIYANGTQSAADRSKVVVAICVQGVKPGTGQGPVNYITYVPDNSKRITSA